MASICFRLNFGFCLQIAWQRLYTEQALKHSRNYFWITLCRDAESFLSHEDLLTALSFSLRWVSSSQLTCSISCLDKPLGLVVWHLSVYFSCIIDIFNVYAFMNNIRDFLTDASQIRYEEPWQQLATTWQCISLTLACLNWNRSNMINALNDTQVDGVSISA